MQLNNNAYDEMGYGGLRISLRCYGVYGDNDQGLVHALFQKSWTCDMGSKEILAHWNGSYNVEEMVSTIWHKAWKIWIQTDLGQGVGVSTAILDKICIQNNWELFGGIFRLQ